MPNTSCYNHSTTTTGSNDTSDNNCLTELKWARIMSIVFYSLAFVLGVLGNGVVIWVTGFKMKKTVNSVWFLNLAVADFVFTAFLPLRLTYAARNYHWPFGKFMCKLNTTILTLNMFASIYILVVISVDRCVSVVKPIWAQNHRNVQKAFYVSLCVWALALIFSTPYFVFSDIDTSNCSNKIINCYTDFALSDDYETPSVNQFRLFRSEAITITRFVLNFVIPFTVIVSCYAIIIYRLRRNHTLANKSNRSFKIIIAIIITFFFCWAPWHIMGLSMLVFHMTNIERTVSHIFIIIYPIARGLVCLNSCMNPLLYVFMSPDFKDVVRKSILKVLENAFQEEEPRSYTNPGSPFKPTSPLILRCKTFTDRL
ncbi:chemokine-like receptor 1 [Kryptolebias marmoratus]|uniref:chemokine-like receptor 1 n=1 Tax=Kryptolebias marmoratus TaxID=37003 RepID=UPI0007F92E47|nr:chemokine-like receptor 1 [Kryptolebias marmoratus]